MNQIVDETDTAEKLAVSVALRWEARYREAEERAVDAENRLAELRAMETSESARLSKLLIEARAEADKKAEALDHMVERRKRAQRSCDKLKAKVARLEDSPSHRPGVWVDQLIASIQTQRAKKAEAEVRRLRSVLTPSQLKRYDAQRGER